MNPFDSMKLASADFTKSDILVYDYIMANQYDAVQQNIVNMAKSIGVSKSALLRFAKKIGYAGFSEFKYDLARAVHRGDSQQQNYDGSRVAEIVTIYQKTLEYIPQMVDEQELFSIAKIISEARRIKIFGFNITGLTAQYLRLRLSKINIDAEAVTDAVLMSEISQQGQKGDLHIYISTKGSDSTLTDMIRVSHNQCATLLLTMNERSKMLDYSDHRILLPTTNMLAHKFFLNQQVVNYVLIEILISAVSEWKAEEEYEHK